MSFLDVKDIETGDLIQVLRSHFGELNGDVVIDNNSYYEADRGIVLAKEIDATGIHEKITLMSILWNEVCDYYEIEEYFKKWE